MSQQQQFVGEVVGRNSHGLVEIDVKNKFCTGHSLELMTPQGNIKFTLDHMENKKRETIHDAKGSGHRVQIPIPADIDLNHALLMRNLEQNQDTRNPFTPENAST